MEVIDEERGSTEWEAVPEVLKTIEEDRTFSRRAGKEVELMEA